MSRFAFVGLLALAFASLGIVAPAVSATSPAPEDSSPVVAAPLTAAQAKRALDLLQNDQQRKQLIETLRTIVAASPLTAANKVAPPAGNPVAANDLGVAVLSQTAGWAKDTAHSVAAAARNLTDFPALWQWASQRLTDPSVRVMLLDSCFKAAVVLGAALAAEWLAQGMIVRLSARLRARGAELPADSTGKPLEPGSIPGRRALRRRHLAAAWRRLRQVPLALVLLIFDLLPLAVCAAVGNLLPGTAIEVSDTTRLAILGLLYAYIICRGVMCVTRMLVAPRSPGLRLLPVGDRTAAYSEIWVRRIVIVAAFGTALADVAELLGLAPRAYDALLKLVVLTVHLFLVVIVLRSRHAVARWLHTDKPGAWGLFRNRIGYIWHYPAIFLLVGLWVVWALGLKNGYLQLLYLLASTMLILAATRLAAFLALSGFDRGFHTKPGVGERFPGREERANRYYPLIRGAIVIAIGLVASVALLEAWGFRALSWFQAGAIGGRLVSTGVTIAIVLAVAAALWEYIASGLERHMARLTHQGDYVRVARFSTLLPMLRTGLLLVILGVVCLIVLSEIGVNIAPLLASAGILGIAIGFGSQKLVQDLITGLFLLLENAMQVGDAVTVAGLSGNVEHLSLRTIRLRAGDGSVHIIPFSSVTSVTNTNRGVGNAAVSVNVSYREDTDRVGEVMKQIALDMRQDPAFKDMMTSDLQLWGVDKVDASVATIVGQIVCTDAGRWGVQREYNRRLKIRFQELGIEIANPTQTIFLRTEAQMAARGGGEAKVSDSSPATVKDSPPPTALGHDH